MCNFENGVDWAWSPNLHQMCILGPSRTLLKMVLIDLDLQGHLGLKRSKSAKNRLVRTITHHVFKLGSPNLHKMCILGPSRTLLKMVLIDLDLQGHLGLKRSKSAKNGLVHTITRRSFELWSPNLHQMCIMGPSRTLFNIKRPKPAKNGLVHTITWFWARITKFAPNVYLGTLQNPIENGVDWPWPSRSFGLLYAPN